MKYLIFIPVFFLFNFSFCQNNLVRNSGFEDAENCDTEYLSSNNCYYWSVPDGNAVCPPWYWGDGVGTADWFCSESYLPLNPLPHSGEAYIGARVQTDFNKYKVEYATSQLSQNLIAGKEYMYRFFVYASDEQGDRVGLSFSLQKPKQPCGWGIIDNGFAVENTQPFYKSDGWFEVYGEFTPDNNYQWITIGCFSNNFIDLDANILYYYDDLRIWDYCPDELLIENTVYTFKEYPYEAKLIRAGYNVGNPNPDGKVIVKNGANIIYKAVNDVYLEPGFETETGSEFLAFIAPCGQMCDPLPTPLAGEDLILCSNEPVTLGANTSIPENVEAHWTANPSVLLQYLDNPNSLNPVFTPPNTCASGMFTLTFENECNETVSDQVFVQYNAINTTFNDIVISNLEMDNNFISFTVGTGSCTEYVQIDVFNGDNFQTLIRTERYVPGVDFPCCFLNWTTEGQIIFPPCSDYKIRVTVKNICNSSTITEDIDWPRSEEIELLFFNNWISANGDGSNPCLEFFTSGAEFYHIKVFNRDGNGFLWQLFYDETGPITNDRIITWCPAPFSVSDGTYFWTADFWNTCGTYIYPGGSVYVLSADRNQTNSEEFQIYEEFEKLPSIYPNPANNELFINPGDYIINQIEISDLSGRIMKTESLSLDNKQPVDISDLPEGLYIFRLFTLSQDVFTFKFSKYE